jgi:hypothetical protein
MTDNKIKRIRIIIAIATFIALFGTLISFFKNWSPSSNTLFLFLLLLISFAILANGVSFISEIFKKDRKYLKLSTGILSLLILIFNIFPRDQGISSITMWAILIGLTFSSILISVFSLLEISHELPIMRVYSFVFAILSGIYSCFISSYISRGYGNSEAGIGYVIYGLIMSLLSIIANSITISFRKMELEAIHEKTND